MSAASDRADLERRRYLENMGKEAMKRQDDLARRTCRFCGQLDGKHHPLCKKPNKNKEHGE